MTEPGATPEPSAAPPSTVLVVDDDDTYRTALARAFERRGFRVLAAASASQALELAAHEEAAGRRVDFASVDLRMPGGSGLDVVRGLATLHPPAIVVVLTGYGSIATAVEAVKLGAADYLTKPADANDLLRIFGVKVGAEPAAGAGVEAGAPLAAAQAPTSKSAVSKSATSRATTAKAGEAEVPSLARVEWEHISRVVADCGGNISQAARLLRMQRRSLQRKLAKYPAAK